MPSYNFQDRFAPAVEAGTKRQTIRKCRRRRPTRVGDTLYLFHNLHRRGCRLLLTSACLEVVPFAVRDDVWFLDGYRMTPSEEEALAQADGFGNAAEMRAWFHQVHGWDFEGEVIRW